MPMATNHAPVNDIAFGCDRFRIVSSPRFKPKSYAVNPDEFSRAGVEWVLLRDGASQDSLDQLGASMRQHDFAVSIRRLARNKYGSVARYAAAYGISYQRLSGVLRGDAILRVEDIVNAERNLGLTLDGWTPKLSERVPQ
jgi:hypothetical protein